MQAQAIPHALAGRDLLASAQTGTGKTAAFALPILHRLSEAARPDGVAKPRCLVLCPTRELANQISESFRVYGKHVELKHAVVYGGVGIRPQADALRRGVDILVATPGRLLDLLGQRLVDLRSVEILVLDEADRMLDMGFINDIRKIISGLTARKQTMLFSATMASEIRNLANAILRNPAVVQTARESPVADRIDQCVYFVPRTEKPTLLAKLVRELPIGRGIVFSRTKRGADRLVKRLDASGIRSEAIHGNKSQNARQRALQNFRVGKISLLIATDVASRGIDVDGITHVVNYDLTDEPETYVHRIGRTARAGASGKAVSFCDPEEMPNLKAIEKLIQRRIEVRNPNMGAQRPQTGAQRPQVGGAGPLAAAAPVATEKPKVEVKHPQFRHPLHTPAGKHSNQHGSRHGGQRTNHEPGNQHNNQRPTHQSGNNQHGNQGRPAQNGPRRRRLIGAV